MELSKIYELYEELKNHRSRFGIWCCDLDQLGFEPNLAVQLGADAVDLAAFLIETLDPDSQFVVLDHHKVIDLISTIAKKQGKQKVLVYNLDLLLAKLDPARRRDFWDLLYSGLVHLPRRIVLMIPKPALMLLPSGQEMDKWVKNKRIVLID